MNKKPVAYVGFFLVLAGILLLGSIFVPHGGDLETEIGCFFTSIIANIAGCVCGIIGWKNRLGKAAVILALPQIVFYNFVLVMLILYPPHFGYSP